MLDQLIISVDVKEIQDFAYSSQYLWASVLDTCIILFLLLNVLGPAALGGVFVMLIAIPIGTYGTKKLSNYQGYLSESKDESMGIVQEAIQELEC